MHCFKTMNIDSIYNYLYNDYTKIFVSEEIWNSENNIMVTSFVEHEMREINRRTDIGCRWSKKGVENLLKIKLVEKYSHNDWEKFFPPATNNKLNLKVTLCTYFFNVTKSLYYQFPKEQKKRRYGTISPLYTNYYLDF